MSSFFADQVLLPYTMTLRTQALYTFPLTFNDAPLEVKSEASSLNVAQAHLTLILNASTAPPPARSYRLSCRTKQT